MKTTLLRPIIIAVLCVTFLAFLLPASSVAASPTNNAPVVHQVQPGETLAVIARRYGATVDSLMALNNLRNPDRIFAGQRLVIRAGATQVGGTVHIVQRGETLSGIASRYGVTIAAIKQANNLQSSVIYVNQRLRLPGGASPGAGEGNIHVVQRGETLSGIARRYGTSVEALARLNGIAPNGLLRVGQRLAVSGGGSGAPAASGPKKIVVEIGKQRCYRYEGEVLLDTWACSTGMRNYGTKTGTFRVQSKLRKAYGSTWDIWMPYWLGIYWAGATENGFHGIPWDARTGKKIWAGLVGTPATYGCVMLRDGPMQILWEWADIGTTVVIRR